MSDQRVQFKLDDDGIAWITLARVDRHNAVDIPMLKAMRALQKRLRKLPRVRGAIIHGDGPSFCSGLDFKSVLGSPRQRWRALLELWSPTMNLFQDWSMGWRQLPFPVIAALHGHCYGAGLQLALGADRRIAASDTHLALMETQWGLVPDMGGPTLLRELMPMDVAKDLLFSGRVLQAPEAVSLGLVSELAVDPLAAAHAQLLTWAQRSPDALAAGKFLLQQAWLSPSSLALDAERRAQRKLLGRRNQRIAMKIGPKAIQPGDFVPRRVQR